MEIASGPWPSAYASHFLLKPNCYKTPMNREQITADIEGGTVRKKGERRLCIRANIVAIMLTIRSYTEQVQGATPMAPFDVHRRA